MSLVAKLSYNEGECVCSEIEIVIGFLPKQGATLLAISDSALVGFVKVVNKELAPLKTGLQLKIGEGNSITWSKTLKQYVVVGNKGYIVISNNGVLWKAVENPSLKDLRKIIWNETLSHYMAVGKAGAILVSKDGKEWQASEAKREVNLNDILWCPIKNQYVLIGDEGYIALSSNGINWQIQPNSVKSNLIGIAGTGQWDDKVHYLVITQKDEVIESTDGKRWGSPLKQPANTKAMQTVYYNHIYGNGGTKERGKYRFYSIMTSEPSPFKGIYRGHRYYTNGIEYNGKYTYSASWAKNYNYLRDYANKESPQISEIRCVFWFDEIKLFVAVGNNPPIFFQNGYSDKTWVWDRVNIEANFQKFVQEGFSDIACGEIPEFKDDEKVIYYDLNQYS